ncbi:hypothetical protein F4818DRAFT_436226 [Hypoxylon cercidicola]|nr:hypothetical protein F4818DRAFT_436226 [Hypoxylon cercidicola]
MARHNQSKSRQPRRTELDLSAVINVEQKFQLQRLIIAILDDMQKQIREVHEDLTPAQVAPDQGINPPQATCLTIPNPRSEKYRDMFADTDQGKVTNLDTEEDFQPVSQAGKTTGLKVKKENTKPGSQGGKATDPKIKKENAKPLSGADNTTKIEKPVWKAPKSPEEARAMYQKTDKQILVNSVSELKRDTLAHFSKWRQNVLRRVQDIIIKNGGTSGNVGGQEPQQVPGNARRHVDAARGRPTVPSGPTGPNASGENPIAVLARLYPPVVTPLRESPKEKRALILHSMLLILLGLDQYAVYSRILLVRLTSSLNVPVYVLQQDEVRVSQALSKIIKGIPIEEIAQRRAEEAKSRRWRPGMASAAVADDPGTLSPHLITAGVGTVFGGIGMNPVVTASLLASMNESTVVVGTLFGLYGARQGSKTMSMYGKDIQGFGMIPLHGPRELEISDPKDVLPEHRRMRVTIGMPGLMSSPDDLVESWKFLGSHNETYAMRWEEDGLIRMNTALELLVKSPTWNSVKKEITSRTVYDRLTQVEWPIGLLKASKIVETPWCTAVIRADKAGAALADMLINKSFGERPVSLIGYSLGARIIYHCVMVLSEKRAFGLVENVIMMGTPCPSEVRVWAAIRTVVGGRLINVYSREDYLLGFLSRNICWHYGVAGLQKVEGVPHVENFDASEVVSNHLRYRYLVGSILKKVGWEDIDYPQVTAEQQKLAAYIRELEQESERGNSTKSCEGAQED